MGNKAHFKGSREFLRQQRRSTDAAIECYLGKSALLQTYEEMGIDNPEVEELRRVVRRKREQLINRGSL